MAVHASGENYIYPFDEENDHFYRGEETIVWNNVLFHCEFFLTVQILTEAELQYLKKM